MFKPLPLAALALAVVAAAVQADSVKLSGFWIDDVTVQTITDGRIVYVSPTGGQVEKPLGDLQGLKLTNLPQLEQAEKALEAGQTAQAIKLLQDARKRSRQDWANQLLSKRIVEAQTAGGLVGDALQGYLELSRSATDPWFVPAPPLEAFAKASDPQKAKAREVATNALARADEAQKAVLQQVLDAAGPAPAPAAASATPKPAPARPAATQPATPSAPAPAATPAAPTPSAAPAAAKASAVPLPRQITDGPIADPLRAGRFEEALAAADRELQTPGEMSAKLFLRGVAQLALAEKSGDEAMYKNAGLSFMRVAVHFPKSTHLGPALLEAGYVHLKIGRPDIAAKLFERARVLIDEDDPAYFERMNKVLAAAQ